MVHRAPQNPIVFIAIVVAIRGDGPHPVDPINSPYESDAAGPVGVAGIGPMVLTLCSTMARLAVSRPHERKGGRAAVRTIMVTSKIICWKDADDGHGCCASRWQKSPREITSYTLVSFVCAQTCDVEIHLSGTPTISQLRVELSRVGGRSIVGEWIDSAADARQ
jgi:hypothetical protein